MLNVFDITLHNTLISQLAKLLTFFIKQADFSLNVSSIWRLKKPERNVWSFHRDIAKCQMTGDDVEVSGVAKNMTLTQQCSKMKFLFTNLHYMQWRVSRKAARNFQRGDFIIIIFKISSKTVSKNLLNAQSFFLVF